MSAAGILFFYPESPELSIINLSRCNTAALDCVACTFVNKTKNQYKYLSSMVVTVSLISFALFFAYTASIPAFLAT